MSFSLAVKKQKMRLRYRQNAGRGCIVNVTEWMTGVQTTACRPAVVNAALSSKTQIIIFDDRDFFSQTMSRWSIQ